MGRCFKWAGDKDFGAFAFQGDVVYDVDDLGDVEEGFVDRCIEAGAAEVAAQEKPAPKRTAKKDKVEE